MSIFNFGIRLSVMLQSFRYYNILIKNQLEHLHLNLIFIAFIFCSSSLKSQLRLEMVQQILNILKRDVSEWFLYQLAPAPHQLSLF